MTQQARERAEFDDVLLAGADGMQSQNFLETVQEAGDGLFTSGPDLAFANAFYEETFLPAYYELCGCDQTLSVFHAHAFDAGNLILDAIDTVSIEDDEGTLWIPRTALRDEFFADERLRGRHRHRSRAPRPATALTRRSRSASSAPTERTSGSGRQRRNSRGPGSLNAGPVPVRPTCGWASSGPPALHTHPTAAEGRCDCGFRSA